ncbi:MAG TPA: DUF4276 family protein [Lentisphaeria bacterium]|nr:DUF4276 family protein [Lentisphaeria bacterium]
MIRLHITAEGHAEQAFVRKVFAPHLALFGIAVDARCVLTSKDNRAAKEYRGGLLSYRKAKGDIQNWLKEDNHPECRFSTMFDLYALPDDFPGYVKAEKITDPYQRVGLLEESLKNDINDRRFTPYIQLHEFEALILAEPRQLDWEYLEHDSPIRNLIVMMQGQNPELINAGPTTAPSKRILKEIPEYDKVTAGVAVVEKIGLSTLRQKCRHFNDWLTSLERLANVPS